MNPILRSEILTTKGGVQLNILRSDEIRDATLLCIPGGPGLGVDSLMPGIFELASSFNLVLLDPRGHGSSTDALDGNYSLLAYAADIAEVVSRISVKGPLGIFGHSFGGCIALQTLAMHPDVFKFGVIANAPFDNSWLEEVPGILTRLNDPDIQAADSAFDQNPTNENYRELMAAYVRLYFPELLMNDAKTMMRKWSYRADSFKYASSQIFGSLALKQAIQGIQVPTLFIGGGLDDLITAKKVSEMGRLAPKGDTVIIEKAGHFPFISRSREFSETVARWWNSKKEGVTQ